MHRDKLESSTERKREKEGNGEETKEWSRKKSSVWKKNQRKTNTDRGEMWCGSVKSKQGQMKHRCDGLKGGKHQKRKC